MACTYLETWCSISVLGLAVQLPLGQDVRIYLAPRTLCEARPLIL